MNYIHSGHVCSSLLFFQVPSIQKEIIHHTIVLIFLIAEVGTLSASVTMSYLLFFVSIVEFELGRVLLDV